jgi:hypothetical protein
MAIILVAARVGSTRGGRIGDFDDHAALDTVVAAVGYIQVALSVDDDAIMVVELAWIGAVEDAALAGCSTGWILVKWSAVRSELDHSPVVRVRDIHVAVAINGNAAG